MLKPPPLPEGGTIGVAAASSPFENRSEIDRGVRWYEQRGYRVKLAPGVHARDDYVAGDAQARADDVTALFADDEVDVVQMLRGGYGASQVLPHLDYDVIAANPKPFVGYSDVTALHVAIRQRTGLVTFYGLGLTSMGAPKREELDKDWFIRAMTATDRPPRPSPRAPRRPVHRHARLGTRDRSARRRLPLAAARDARHTVGGRARRRDFVLRGRACAAVARRRHAHAAEQRREARADERRRHRRDAQVPGVRPARALAAQPLDGGRLRTPS